MKKYLKLTLLFIAIAAAVLLCTVAAYANEAEEMTPRETTSLSEGYNTPLPPSGVDTQFEYVYHSHDKESEKENCFVCALLHPILSYQKYGTYDCPFCAAGTMHPIMSDNFFIEYLYFSEEGTACYMLRDTFISSSSQIFLDWEVDENGDTLDSTAISGSLISKYIALVSPEGMEIYNIEKMMEITVISENGEVTVGTYGLAAYYSAKLSEAEAGQTSDEVMALIDALVINTCSFGTSAASYRYCTAIDKDGNTVSNPW